MDRRARIEAGAVTSAQARAAKCCGLFQAAIASYEFITVTSHREAAFTCADKGHAIRKLIVIGITREDRALVLFEISHDVDAGCLAIHTEREFVVIRDRKPPAFIGAIRQAQQRNLNRRIEGREHEQLLRDTLTGMFENAVAVAMPDNVGSHFANRQRRRRPNHARILIANVDDFA